MFDTIFRRTTAWFHRQKTPSIWVVTLVLCSLAMAISNYSSQVWLTGWDTLHPEFDYGLNFWRMLFGVWREDQGLGAVAAHAHMSDAPRLLVLWLLDLFLPVHSVKFAYVLACLVLGPLGVYYFFKKHIMADDTPAHNAAALLAGIFYLMSLGTVQHFYVVFEMFAVQFAALGWLFLAATLYLKSGSKGAIKYFAALTIFSAPMAYAPTLWYAYAGSMALYLLGISALEKSRVWLWRTVTVGLVIFALNAFWLLPNLYLIASGTSSTPTNSHINQLFSPEAFLHNQAYGSIIDVSILKNFLFNWAEYQTAENTYQPLLLPWIDHLSNPLVLVIGYSVFVLVFVGIWHSWQTRNFVLMALLPIALLSAFMLMNTNPPFGWFFAQLRNNQLFEEALRFPFTKFSLLLQFAYALFAAYAAGVLLKRLQQNMSVPVWMPTALITILMIFYALPAFQGNLINPKMRNDIPGAYFSFFEWTKTQPDHERFAQFPLQTSFGWNKHTWNYEGPGFIWFGMNQPVLLRDFDRWNQHNESFYQQVAQAVYAKDAELVRQVFEQYHVKYILIDSSIIDSSMSEEQMLDKYGVILEQAGANRVWQEDFLHVYAFEDISAGQAFFTTPQQAENIQTIAPYTRLDIAYQNFGSYYSSQTDNAIIFPFADVHQNRSLNTTFENNTITFTASELAPMSELRVPPLSFGDTYTTTVQLGLFEEELFIMFADPVTIEMGSQQFSLSQLADQTIPVPLTERLLVQIGNQEIAVSQNSVSDVLAVSFEAGEAIQLIIADYYTIGEGVENIQELIVPATIWQPLMTEKVFSVPTESPSVTVNIPSQEILIDGLGAAEVFNCDIFQRGAVTSHAHLTTQALGASNRGAACLSSQITEMTTHDSFIFRLIGKNHQGRDMKMYLYNHATSRTDLEHLLPGAEFDHSFAVFPWTNAEEKLYDLTVESRSFGSHPSSSALEYTYIYPAPLEQLASMYLVKGESLLNNQQTTVAGTKLTPTHYRANVAIESETDGIISFLHSAESGWIAFPGLKFWQSFEKISYNGWANAWIIPSGSWRITVLYWPQLLSVLGYGLSISSFLGINFFFSRYPKL